jgi:hypothetical protein
MGGGSGKSSTGSSSNWSQYAPALMKMWKTAKPVYQTLASQTEQGLQTGGVNANIPLINTKMDAARQAESQSMQQARQTLGRSSLAGTPFGQELLASLEQQGGQNISNIPASTTAEFVGGAAPQVIGTGARAVGEAAQLNTSSTYQSTPSFGDYFMQGASAGGMAGTGLGMMGYTPFAASTVAAI